ncbi:MAG: hypothetical protein DBP01_03655 [gamma proteobacterium symbiont of Ctena orbiculata]|nr:MAG: hypothetical protein DBP01_03655 [gamma proteobacterium symbiont of Ctena orbiculata]
MDRRNYYLGLIFGPLLLLPAFSTQAAMYKWYDEQGKLNYTQSPPPPGSRRATINSDSFSTVNMHKVPSLNAPQCQRGSAANNEQKTLIRTLYSCGWLTQRTSRTRSPFSSPLLNNPSLLFSAPFG